MGNLMFPPGPTFVESRAWLTIFGTNFSDRERWQLPAVRVLTMIPPARFYGQDLDPISTSDCHDWLMAFVRLTEPVRMLAHLEGGVKRGWFYTVILDNGQRENSLDQIREAAVSASPWNSPIEATEVDGPFECMHIIGRFGLTRTTEVKS